MLRETNTKNGRSISERLSSIGATAKDIAIIIKDFSNESILRALKNVEDKSWIQSKAHYFWKLIRTWEGKGQKYNKKIQNRLALEKIEQECRQKEAEEFSNLIFSSEENSCRLKRYLETHLSDSTIIPLPALIKKKIKEDLSLDSWKDSSRVRLASRLLLDARAAHLDFI